MAILGTNLFYNLRLFYLTDSWPIKDIVLCSLRLG